MPAIPLQSPSNVIDRQKQNETSFFSAFTSYISSYAADDPPEPSDEELESTLCTVDCVNQCHIGDIFANVSALSAQDLEALVDALLAQIPDDNGPEGAVMTVKAENIPLSSPTNGQKARQNTAVYDPTLVYVIEYCTVLALRDRETIELLGKRVIGAIHTIVRDFNNYHPIVIERATYYLFALLQASYVSPRLNAYPHCRNERLTTYQDFDLIRVPILLHTVSLFSKGILLKTSSLVLRGLKECTEKPCPLKSEMMTSPDFWVILRTLATNSDSAPAVFEILESGVSGTPSAIIADNYEAAIGLLNEFASMASIGAIEEQRADSTAKKSGRKPVRPVKQDKKPSENAVVARGIKAIHIISQMTERIPHLMKQSHLESNEGKLRK